VPDFWPVLPEVGIFAAAGIPPAQENAMSQIQRSFLAILAITNTALLLLASGPSYSRGLIQSSCAPWDGPAIAITLAPEAVQCDRAPYGPYLSMGVWRGLPLHDGQIVKFGSGSDNGFASRCAKENDCQRADSGTIEFEKYSEKSGARGRYELHFKGGETVSAAFDVQWCNTRSICG